MKTLKILSLALVSIALFLSCKNKENPSEEITINHENNIAIIDLITDDKNTEIDYLYVTSTSGLSLREYANLQSEKLAIMPYGSKVKIISSELKPTMKVEEISGGMDHIEFNHKKGFAFNGYLSKYFPPEKGISAKKYSGELLLAFPTVNYSETKTGTVSNPINTEKLTLPETQWHEAFYMAQQLFNIPKEFEFPASKGKDKEVILEKRFKEKNWTSELQITRKEGTLSKIKYKYKNKRYTKTVSIYKEGEMMVIDNIEDIK
ncbi:MAG: SH3 domain-containing protein [Flavobacteriaceae bacterium]|mgnify:CR=1 FL=1|jgi:hypothetical protein|nr:SH3 domain-containing protein [Flavobacteriaceae bacterium]